MCTVSIGTGREEWGADPGKEYFRFHIEKIGKLMGIAVVDTSGGKEDGSRTYTAESNSPQCRVR